MTVRFKNGTQVTRNIESVKFDIGFASIEVIPQEGATSATSSLLIRKVNNINGDEQVVVLPVNANQIEIR